MKSSTQKSENPAQEFLGQQQARVRKPVSLAIALGSFSGLLIIAETWCLANVVNAAMIEQQALAELMPWLWAMLLILLVRVATVYLSEQVAFSAAATVKQLIRQRLVNKLQQLGPLALGDTHSGGLSALLLDGVESLENYFARYLPAMSIAVWVPLAILLFVFPLDWKSALVFLFTAPLIPFFMILIGKGAQRLNQQQWQVLTRMGGHFLDVIQGLTTLKLFNASRREIRLIEKISEDYRLATMRVLRLAFLSSLALEFFATVSIAIVAVLVGFRLYFGEMDFLTGFYILLLAPEFYLPLRNMGTHYHARMDALAAAESLHQWFTRPLPTRPQPAEPEQPPTLPASAAPAIEFDRVSLSYGDRQALQGLSFDIQAGEQIALVGPSGAGKSSVIHLLLGFVQADAGHIRIDGQPLQHWQLDEWRRQIAWIPQRPRLFHGSVRENICLGLPACSDEQVHQALLHSGSLGFVERLPHGLDTLVGESGQGLSGGQVQRLAIARAWMRDARLLLLDEPTAHLDSHTQQAVNDALQRLKQGKTVLTVAHRLSTIEDADRILVMSGGQVVEQGRPVELREQDGLYRQLLSSQLPSSEFGGELR